MVRPALTIGDDRVPDERGGPTRYLMTEGDLGDLRRRVVEDATVVIERAAAAGITVAAGDGPCTAACTDPLVPDLDQAQYRSGQGPCLDAIRHRRLYVVPSTQESPSWREFCRAAYERGILSTMSLPLVAADRVMGALNLYAREEAAFTEDDRGTGLRFATRAAVLLADAEAYAEARELSRRIGEAMTARATIEQAKGIIMGAQRCSPDEAFVLLRSAASREDLATRDLARRIVDGARRPDQA
jgi:GAF domain-containing protein